MPRTTDLNRRSVLLAGGAALASSKAVAQALGGGSLPGNVVLVGTSLTLAPFSFINEKGDSVGFELDIIQAIADRLGLKVSYVRVPFSQNFTSLNAGVFRIGAASAFMTCPRLNDPKGVGRFSVPTYSSGQAISTKSALAPKVKGFADLAGKKVGVESVGSTADKLVDEAMTKSKFEKVVFPTIPRYSWRSSRAVSTPPSRASSPRCGNPWQFGSRRRDAPPRHIHPGRLRVSGRRSAA